MNIEEMNAFVLSSVSPSRYRHTLGVIETALNLSKVYGEDPEKTRIAALLHDCAKSMDPKEMLAVCREENILPDEFEIRTPSILHAPAGAAFAKRQCGIRDEEILHAIRCHTIGCLHPNKLDAIIFVADFIEPGRKEFDGLERARALSKINLLDALKKCARLSNEYVVSAGGQVHPITLKMINDTEDLT